MYKNPGRAILVLAVLTLFAAADCRGSSAVLDADNELRDLEDQIWAQKQELAMNEMRLVASAFELYGAAYMAFPGPTQGLVNLGSMEGELHPFLRRVDLHDPWGKPYLYWSNGREYVLVSTSADRKLDRDYDRLSSASARELRDFLRTGGTSDVTKDLVLFEGQFTGWFEDGEE